jgi:hypothetical protein
MSIFYKITGLIFEKLVPRVGRKWETLHQIKRLKKKRTNATRELWIPVLKTQQTNKNPCQPGAVACACNPSYSKQRSNGLRPA